MKSENVTQPETRQHSVENEQVAHIAGFFDAAGNVSISIFKDAEYGLGYGLQPKLELRRPSEDDPMLGKLMEYCDDEGVRFSISEVSQGTDEESPRIVWTVKDPDSIERFLRPLMEYLVTNYFRAELMLEVVLPAIEQDQHRTEQGFYELVGVAEKLREGKRLTTEPKYTQEYFEDEWSVAE
jgi:hypothetical protein